MMAENDKPAPMKKYRVNASFIQPEVVEVELVKESDCFVWISEKRRDAKRSSWFNYFDTWEEAHDFLSKKALEKKHGLERQAEAAALVYFKILAMKKPDGAAE